MTRPERRPVPVAEPVQERSGHGLADRPVGPGVEVGVAAVPGVAHRGEAVADVRHSPGGRTALATQWLRLTTRSTSPSRHARVASGISGRSLR